jgi:hypothetical protein
MQNFEKVSSGSGFGSTLPVSTKEKFSLLAYEQCRGCEYGPAQKGD